MSAFVFSRVILASLQDAGRFFMLSGGVALPPSRERSTPGYRSCKPSAWPAGDAFEGSDIFRRLAFPLVAVDHRATGSLAFDPGTLLRSASEPRARRSRATALHLAEVTL